MNNRVSSFHLSQDEEAAEAARRRVDSRPVLIKYFRSSAKRHSAELSLGPKLSEVLLAVMSVRRKAWKKHKSTAWEQTYITDLQTFPGESD